MWKNSVLKQTFHKLFYILCVIQLTSCGWHVAETISHQNPTHLSIPYASGDSSGELTNAVIAIMSTQPGFTIDDTSLYQLKISILDDKEQRIGYRYDPAKEAKGKKKLIPNENRDKRLVQVSLIDRQSNKTMIGPAYILGSIEYDHQENSIDNDINDFSLGQLADINAAQDVTYIPLYRDLAKKISYWLQNQKDRGYFTVHQTEKPDSEPTSFTHSL